MAISTNVKKIVEHIGDVEISLDFTPLTNRLTEAQKLLNMQVVSDSEKYIPFSQGALRGSVRYPQGVDGGEISYNTPYAHYQYVGTVYGPNIPIKDAEGNITGWWSPPKKQPTSRKLTYGTPGTGSQWFETAKAQHGKEWIDLVKRTAGG